MMRPVSEEYRAMQSMQDMQRKLRQVIPRILDSPKDKLMLIELFGTALDLADQWVDIGRVMQREQYAQAKKSFIPESSMSQPKPMSAVENVARRFPTDKTKVAMACTTDNVSGNQTVTASLMNEETGDSDSFAMTTRDNVKFVTIDGNTIPNPKVYPEYYAALAQAIHEQDDNDEEYGMPQTSQMAMQGSAAYQGGFGGGGDDNDDDDDDDDENSYDGDSGGGGNGPSKKVVSFAGALPAISNDGFNMGGGSGGCGADGTRKSGVLSTIIARMEMGTHDTTPPTSQYPIFKQLGGRVGKSRHNQYPHMQIIQLQNQSKLGQKGAAAFGKANCMIPSDQERKAQMCLMPPTPGFASTHINQSEFKFMGALDDSFGGHANHLVTNERQHAWTGHLPAEYASGGNVILNTTPSS